VDGTKYTSEKGTPASCGGDLRVVSASRRARIVALNWRADAEEPCAALDSWREAHVFGSADGDRPGRRPFAELEKDLRNARGRPLRRVLGPAIEDASQYLSTGKGLRLGGPITAVVATVVDAISNEAQGDSWGEAVARSVLENGGAAVAGGVGGFVSGVGGSLAGPWWGAGAGLVLGVGGGIAGGAAGEYVGNRLFGKVGE
jgi:hypothetical protein